MFRGKQIASDAHSGEENEGRGAGGQGQEEEGGFLIFLRLGDRPILPAKPYNTILEHPIDCLAGK